jgi:hypothetical protein
LFNYAKGQDFFNEKILILPVKLSITRPDESLPDEWQAGVRQPDPSDRIRSDGGRQVI